MKKTACIFMLMLLLCAGLDVHAAHFARGVPSFSIDGDLHGKSKRTIISQIGEYQVTFATVPAFPLPGENGTIQIKALHLGTKKAFKGNVALKYSAYWQWFDFDDVTVGSQLAEHGNVRFDFQFPDSGKYIINLELINTEETQELSLPLDVGKPFQSMPLILTLMIMAISLSAIRLMQSAKSRGEKAS